MSPFPTGSYTRISDDERAELEAQLAQNRRQYFELAAKLNSGIGFVWLPEELLVEIFKWHMAIFEWWQECLADSLLSNLGKGGSDVYGWLAVTHVCQRWRHVALRTPALWTRIKPTIPECVKTFLERSRDMPLTVEGQIKSDKSANVVQRYKSWAMVFKQSARIRTLRFECALDEDLSEARLRLFSFGSPEFPILKKLLIVGRVDASRLPPVLNRLENNSALEDLRSVYYEFSLVRKLISPNLKMFAMSLSRCSGNPETLWREILESLRQLRYLESIRIVDSLPTVAGLLAPVDESELPLFFPQPVELPDLQKVLAIATGSPKSILTLIKNLSFSPNARVELNYGPTFDDRRDNPSHPALVGSFIAKRFATPASCAALRTLRLCHPAYEGYERTAVIATGWPTTPTSLEATLDLVPLEWLDAGNELFQCTMECSRAEKIFDRFVRQLPLGVVHTLLVGDFVEKMGEAGTLSEAVWRTVFAEAKDVVELSVNGRSADFLPHILVPGPGGEPALFPKLKTLKLHGVVFLEETAEGVWAAGPWLKKLVEALKIRAEAEKGTRLEELIISSAESIIYDEVDVLKEYVGNLRYTGSHRVGPPPDDQEEDEDPDYEGLSEFEDSEVDDSEAEAEDVDDDV